MSIIYGVDKSKDYFAYPTLTPLMARGTKYEREKNYCEELYENGIRRLAERKSVEAESCFRKAAVLGYAKAQMALGALFYGSENPSESARWFRMAADQDVPEAEYYYALCCEKGQGVSEDLIRAADYMKKSAVHGYVPALISCGDYFYRGIGVPVDYETAFFFYHRAALMGAPRAKWKLGSCYFRGEGVEKDEETAAYWFWQAANAGECEAQALVAMCFEFGYGVKKNIEEAEKWYRLGAIQGDEHCASRLRKWR